MATDMRIIGSKQADLAGPGIGSYEEVDRVLPRDYSSLLTLRETQQAIFERGVTASRAILVGWSATAAWVIGRRR